MDARLAPPEQHEAATLQHDTPQVEVSHGVQIGQELQVPDPMVLLEESQQVVVQPPAAGELSHINALSALVGSLSSLVQSLSGMSIPAVASNISALPPASSITVPPVVLHNTQGIQNASFIPESLTPAAPVRASVPEICMKDAMPCEVSPLGFHLSLAVKEKIRKGEFIDILSLLPLHKDFMVRTDRRGDEEDRRRPIPQSFNNWLQAFCIYAGVLAEKHPGLCGGLFQHVDHILEAYKNFGGLGWFYYDESFRQKLSIHPMLSWGMKDVELWLNLIPAQKQLASKPQLMLHIQHLGKAAVLPLMVGNPVGMLHANIGMMRERIRRQNVLRNKGLREPAKHKKIFFLRACTPVRLERMRPWLDKYPDREKACFLLEGFANGFPLPSFWGEGCKVVGNLKSVELFPQVVRDKLLKELAEGRIEGPFVYPPYRNFRISSLGVVPKREPNEFRIIHHLR